MVVRVEEILPEIKTLFIALLMIYSIHHFQINSDEYAYVSELSQIAADAWLPLHFSPAPSAGSDLPRCITASSCLLVSETLT